MKAATVKANKQGTQKKVPLSDLPYQWLSTFLMLQPLNTVPHVVLTPTIRLFLLLLHNCNFATAIDQNVNICVF